MDEGETKFALVEDKDIKKELGDDEISRKKRCRIIILVSSLVVIVAVVLLLVFLLPKSSDDKDKTNPDSSTDIDTGEEEEEEKEYEAEKEEDKEDEKEKEDEAEKEDEKEQEKEGEKEKEKEKELSFLTWDRAHELAKEKISTLNTEEKLNLLFGTDNMKTSAADGGCVGKIDPIEGKFGGICLQDGPAGVRYSTSTQSWQTGINTAATFNRTLMYEVGKAQGKEFREKGVHVALTPAMNIQRSPQGGRLWECFGDDPFLSGEAATQIIKGVQSNGVIACAKHYIGNDQETDRHSTSSNIKEQALFEIYLEPFYRSINDAEVGSIMAAYSAVNGTFCVKHKRLIQDILKDKLGYKGYVMSDWWAITDNSTDNFNSGVDMNMPGGYAWDSDRGRDKSFWTNFGSLIGTEITNERLDDAVERILAPMYKLYQFSSDIKFPEIDLMKNTITEDTKRINREAATQSNVLLKNEDNILPIKNMTGKTIAIIGNDAFESPCIKDNDCSCKVGDNNIFKGHVALGYGSGTTYFNYTTYPLKAITERAEKDGIKIISSGEISQVQTTVEGHEVYEGKEDLEKAKEVAIQADLCIVFIMADSGEQYINLEKSIGDRYNLEAWHGGNDLVNAVLEVNQNVIVVINSPGPINLPWYENVKGIIFSGLGGAESGNAVTSILFGDYNPSGHLPYIWAENENYPAQIDIFTQPKSIEYAEGVFVGQRYFDKYNKVYTFPFGYGLSYTTFEFVSASFQVSMNQEGLKINFSVKNTGSMKGETVPMVFLKFPESIKTEEGYPDKLFKGFDKKWINPNEVAQFEILVDAHALSYYNVFDEKYERPTEGKYTVYVGFDAKNYNMLQAEVDASF
jgi:beta-glucosidase